jgi:CHAD domain-containing protein
MLEEAFSLGQSDDAFEARTYRDTFDWCLHRAGLSLSTSPSGALVRLTLEGVGGRVSEILVPKIPLFYDDLPPSGLKDDLPPGVRPRRLFPQAKANWTTVLVPVLKDGEAVLRLRLREGEAHLPDGSGEIVLGTRVEVFSLPGGETEARKVTKYLRKKLQLRGEKRPEVYAVYDAVGKEPGSYSSSFRLELKSRQQAGRAARRIHRELLQVLLANQEGVTRDWDSEFLHDFRVAIRRTRSALRLLDGVFPEKAVDHFSREFRWLGLRTGPVRDLDVYLHRIPAYRSALEPSARADLEPLVQLLLEKKRREHRRLRDCLRSKRYLRLISEWEAFLAKPASKAMSPPRSRVPIQEVAFLAIRKAFDGVLKRARKLGPRASPEKLHRLRIECKRLRYLLTFFHSLLPAKALRPFLKELKRLQDRLGDFNDLNVQGETLRTFAEELMDSHRVPPQTLLAMGQLLGQMRRSQEEDRATLQKHIGRFTQPKSQELFEMMLGEAIEQETRGKKKTK